MTRRTKRHPKDKYRVETLDREAARKRLEHLESIAANALCEAALDAILSGTTLGPRMQTLLGYFDEHGVGWAALAPDPDEHATERVGLGFHLVEGISVYLHERIEKTTRRQDGTKDRPRVA